MRIRISPMAGVGDHPRLSAWLRRIGCTAAAAVAVLTASISSAAAHPMGPPQQVSIALAAKNQVQVTWKAGAADDLSWLAYDLGLLPADRIMLDGAITPQATDASLLNDSPALSTYLTGQISVSAAGQACAGRVSDIHDLAANGATVVFTCAAPVTDATIVLKLLTDLEASYATIATGPDGTQATYTGYADTHQWRFDPSGAPQGPPLDLTAWAQPVMGAAIGLPAVIGFAVWFLRSRRARQAR